jgi:hypothetical protein
MLNVTRVEEDGEATYEVRGLTEDQAEILAALADFPQWTDQPDPVRGFCAALHNVVAAELPETAAVWAEQHGMTDSTTA